MKKALFFLVVLAQVITFSYLSSGFVCSAAGIAGTITDESGSVLVETRVVLREVVTGIELEARTGDTGRFQFEQLRPGAYTVSAGADGFSEQSRPVILNQQSETARVDFVLNLGALEVEVSVTANRGKRDALAVPLPTQSLNRNLIERTNPTSTGETMIRAIGVTPVGSGPYQVRPRLRGLDSSRLLILVDGQRLNHARVATDRAGVEPSLIEPATIEDIEIVSGTGTSLYGSDALAGTINIITRKPETSDKLKFHGALDAFFSANETGRRGTATVGVSGPQFGLRFSGSLERFGNYIAGDRYMEESQHLHDAGIITQEDTIDQFGFNFGAFPEPFNAPFERTEAEIPNSSAHGSNLGFSGIFSLTKRQTVSVDYMRRRVADVGFPDFEEPFFFQQITLPFSNLDKVSGRYQIFNLGPRFSSFSVRAYHQRHNRLLRNDFPVQFPAPTPQTFFPINVMRLHILSNTEQYVESTGLDTQANFLISPRNVLTTGFTVYQDQSSDSRTTISQLNLVGNVTLGDFGPQANVLPELLPLGPASVAHPVRVPDSSLRDIAFFVQDEWEVSKWVRLYGSLRWDHYTASSDLTEGYEVDSLTSGADPEIPPETLPSLDGESVSRNAWTGDVGLVVRPVEQVALVGHYARSYRHPNLEELFFSGPATVGSLLPNIQVEPETGDNLDFGVKFRTGRFRSGVTYFNNHYNGFISPEIISIGDAGPLFQAINFAQVRIHGIETDFELPFHVADWYFTPWGNLAYQRGDILEAMNPLTGSSLDNTPQDNITPLKWWGGLRVSDRKQRYWAEYSNRIQTRVNRVATLLEESPFLIAQDLFGLYGFTIHRLGWGVNWDRESHRWGLSFALENLGDKFYRDHFQFAPARGRSFTVGFHIETF